MWDDDDDDDRPTGPDPDDERDLLFDMAADLGVNLTNRDLLDRHKVQAIRDEYYDR